MKYIRKTVAIVLIIVLFIALAICAAVATTIKNINVTYSESTGESSSAYVQTLENLQALKGGNIFLLGEDDVASCVADSARINLVSYEKSYPCTINITMSERVETFYSYADGVCNVYDSDGVFMYSSENIADGTEEDGFVLAETEDGSPNVLIDDVTQAVRTFIASSCSSFKESFGALRGMVKYVYREKNPDSENLVFVLRTGLEIEISNCDSLTAEKIACAYTRYQTLTDGQKTGGLIHVYTQENSEDAIRSDYLP